MDIKEAMKIALERECYHTRGAGVIYDDEITKQEHDYHVKMMYFFETVGSSLCKELAMKPLREKREHSNGYCNVCPICHDSLEWDPYELHHPRFCPNCGQRLDWSDKNES